MSPESNRSWMRDPVHAYYAWLARLAADCGDPQGALRRVLADWMDWRLRQYAPLQGFSRAERLEIAADWHRRALADRDVMAARRFWPGAVLAGAFLGGVVGVIWNLAAIRAQATPPVSVLDATLPAFGRAMASLLLVMIPMAFVGGLIARRKDGGRSAELFREVIARRTGEGK